MRWVVVVVVALAFDGVMAFDRGASGGQNPLLDPDLVVERGSVVGRVVDRAPAGSYTYLQLLDASGARFWVVTVSGPATSVADVRATLFARAAHFHSRRLGRDFSPLWFASISPTPSNELRLPQERAMP